MRSFPERMLTPTAKETAIDLKMSFRSTLNV